MSFEEKYEFIQASNQPLKIGYGAYSQVLLARSRQTRQMVAVKIMDKQFGVSVNVLDIMINEYNVHKQLNHESIIRYIDAYDSIQYIYIVQEYAQNGSLFNFLCNVKKFKEEESRKYFLQVCKGVQYMHTQNLMYRDLKPENMLLDSKLHVKLCDFGSCVSFQIISDKRLIGTCEYMAPEILQRNPYDYRVDIWSLGVFLYELLHGKAPYQGLNSEQVLASIQTTQLLIDNTLSSDVQTLIRKLLRFNPIERPTRIEDIFNDPWCTKIYQYQQQQQQQQQLQQQKIPHQIKNSPIVKSVRYFSPQKNQRNYSNNGIPIISHQQQQYQQQQKQQLSPFLAVKQRENYHKVISTPEKERTSPSPPKYIQNHISKKQFEKQNTLNGYNTQKNFLVLIPTTSQEKGILPTQRIKDKALGNDGLLTRSYNNESGKKQTAFFYQNNPNAQELIQKNAIFQGRPKY